MNDVPPTGSADSEVMAPLAPSSSPAPSSCRAVVIRIVGEPHPRRTLRIVLRRSARRRQVRPSRPRREFRRGRACADLGATSNEAMPTTSGIGVLLVNLGTPDAAEPKAVRRYLKEFLSDPRVIEKDIRCCGSSCSTVSFCRCARGARRATTEKIWNREKNESPLKTITRSQAEKLAGILEPLGKHVIVDWAMRYASPSIASRLEALVARGCDRILVMPLYPQYAAPTTATVGDEVFRFLMRQRRQPAMRIMPAYYDDPYYIEVLSSSLKAELKALPFTPDVIVASYHGMPQDYVQKGDPYERPVRAHDASFCASSSSSTTPS